MYRVEGLECRFQEAWSFYRIIPGVRLCWELEKPQGPKVSGCQRAGFEVKGQGLRVSCSWFRKGLRAQGLESRV
jgi:hypothetical protein